ncbi:MAG: LytTR family DNA-binding domain-containing protein [Deltaproteobacteria bacterium]|nr:LytTR family DNA-binding domain-containing protein [Deltaproteobacteria bacterium]
MPVTVYVAEDEPLARDALVQMLEAIPGWDVIGAADNGERALQECLEHQPDVLITDIRMPRLDGLELCAALRTECPAMQFVFVTAYSEHGVAAFRLAAADYLLKPISDAEFQRCIARVQEAVRRQQAMERLDAAGVSIDALLKRNPGALQRLVVRSVGRVEIVPLSEVVAFVAERNYIDIIGRNRTWVHRETLKSLMTKLQPGRFVRIHRSVIVAVDNVRGLERQGARTMLTLDTGATFAVGARYVERVQTLLGV